jgi:tetratricopeptide (TPR) repeat protein
MLAALTGLMTFFVYLPTLRNGFVSWDDGHYVYENRHILRLGQDFLTWALTEATIVYWHPLTWLSHAIDVTMWGINPLGHHLTNNIFHASNTFLVVLLAANLVGAGHTSRTWESGPPCACDQDRFVLIAAGITGVLFGLHPVHVESAAWVAERKDLLYSFFYLLGMLSYVGFVRAQGEDPQQRSFVYYRAYWLCLLCYALSLASKPMAVTFPVILLLLDWYPLRRDLADGEGGAQLIEKVPFLVLGGALSVYTLYSEKVAGVFTALTDIPMKSRILVAFHAVVVYIGKLIFPVDLLPLYPYPPRVLMAQPEFAGSVIAVVGATVLCTLYMRKRPLWLVVWGSFTISVLPVLGLFQAGPQPWADRFIYLPSLGPFMLVGIGGGLVWQKVSRRPLLRRSLAVSAALLVVLLSVMTVSQIGIWKNSMVMWTHVIEKVPHQLPFAYHNRSILFKELGDLDKALEDANEAIALAPGFPDAYHNRGNVFAGKGQYASAVADYLRAIYLKPDDPVISNDLGAAHAGMGEVDAAIAAYGRALALKPDYGDVYNNRGVLFTSRGDYVSALADFERAGRLSPDDPVVYVNRGLAYAGQGKAELAEKEYTAAIALGSSPDLASNARTVRGMARFRRHDLSAALEDFNAAVSLTPESIVVYNNRGAVYRALGQYTQAVDDYGRVLSLDPSFVKAYLDRGDIFMQIGRPDLARQEFIAACRLGNRSGCDKSRLVGDK